MKFERFFCLSFFISLFIGVDIVRFGNSSSSGVFLSDILVVTSIFIFPIKKIGSYLSLRVNVLLQLFLVLVSLYVLLFDMVERMNFVFYGLLRLCFYLLFIFTFARFVIRYVLEWRYLQLFGTSIAIVYIVHSLGIIDISLTRQIGKAFITDIEYLNSAIKNRVFIGHNSITASALITLVFVLIKHQNNNWFKGYIFKWHDIIFFLALVSTGARTDTIAFFALIMLSTRHIKMSNLIVFMLIATPLVNFIPDRILNADIFAEITGSSSGTLSYRLQEWFKIVNESTSGGLSSFGYGINNFRVLREMRITHLNFGHNTFLHTFIEGGLFSLVTLFLFVLVLFRRRFFIPLGVFLLIKMLTTDIFTSVDGASNMNFALLLLVFLYEKEHCFLLHNNQPLSSR